MESRGVHRPCAALPFFAGRYDRCETECIPANCSGAIARNDVLFNLGGASGGFEDKPGGGEGVYWPGEGRFLFSLQGAVEGKVFGSQVEFQMEGRTYAADGRARYECGTRLDKA